MISVWNLPMMLWYSKLFDQKLALGSFTHEFLQVFEARNTFIPKHSQEIFQRNIQSRSSRLKNTTTESVLPPMQMFQPTFLEPSIRQPFGPETSGG
jgi:hypothetical protein